MATTKRKARKSQAGSSTTEAGKLRIGDDWNAISIIALSQANPLKAVAEFVENSIDARARRVTIVRGKERGGFFLRIVDDGEGVPRTKDGVPDFRYVATHICDSVKRQLKDRGTTGIQGEFGIGLLSFWTVGEELNLSCAGTDGVTYQMRMRKGSPDYEVARRRVLIPPEGTELTVAPLLPGLRQLTGERIQRYLSAELRDRIRTSGVQVRVIDRTARAEYAVEPRQFSGQLLHDLPSTPESELYLELYLNPPADDNRVGLYRQGTRVLSDLTEIEPLEREPWSSRLLQGIVDAPFLNLTPGTRQGVVRDAAFERFLQALEPVAARLAGVLEEQRRAEEESANRDVLKSVQRALKEAFLALPPEEYDWFDVYGLKAAPWRDGRAAVDQPPLPVPSARPRRQGGDDPSVEERPGEMEAAPSFFEFPGPLHSTVISPRSCVVPVGATRQLRAVCRDLRRRPVEADLTFAWAVVEGGGSLAPADAEVATFHAAHEPGLVVLRVTARQGECVAQAEAMVTVTEELVPQPETGKAPRKGLPSYTFQRAPGQTWRSRYDAEQNVVVVNNGHRDFVYASRSRARKLRYISRLFGKELVLHNFPGQTAEQLLERMAELTLYTEENLR